MRLFRHSCAVNLTAVIPIPRLCSAQTAADLLGVSVTTVLRRIHDGQLDTLGKLEGQTGSYVLNLDEIEALAAKGRQ